MREVTEGCAGCDGVDVWVVLLGAAMDGTVNGLVNVGLSLPLSSSILSSSCSSSTRRRFVSILVGSLLPMRCTVAYRLCLVAGEGDLDARALPPPVQQSSPLGFFERTLRGELVGCETLFFKGRSELAVVEDGIVRDVEALDAPKGLVKEDFFFCSGNGWDGERVGEGVVVKRNGSGLYDSAGQSKRGVNDMPRVSQRRLRQSWTYLPLTPSSALT